METKTVPIDGKLQIILCTVPNYHDGVYCGFNICPWYNKCNVVNKKEII